MNFRYAIGPSIIHGQGLFAKSTIKAGSILGRCRVVATKKSGPYTLSREDGDYLVTCKLRFINHSDSPNVVYYDDLSVVALKDLVPGEELTHDYGDHWD